VGKGIPFSIFFFFQRGPPLDIHLFLWNIGIYSQYEAGEKGGEKKKLKK
jgi:hypothetical protein